MKKGKVVVGDALDPGVSLETAADVTFDSRSPTTSSLTGRLGLEDAVKKGILRVATQDDVRAWNTAQLMQVGFAGPPFTGGGIPVHIPPVVHHGYVVLKEFDVPAGMFWKKPVVFFVPKGVPQPRGNLGYYSVYDFNSMLCRGSICHWYNKLAFIR